MLLFTYVISEPQLLQLTDEVSDKVTGSACTPDVADDRLEIIPFSFQAHGRAGPQLTSCLTDRLFCRAEEVCKEEGREVRAENTDHLSGGAVRESHQVKVVLM